MNPQLHLWPNAMLRGSDGVLYIPSNMQLIILFSWNTLLKIYGVLLLPGQFSCATFSMKFNWIYDNIG